MSSPRLLRPAALVTTALAFVALLLTPAVRPSTADASAAHPTNAAKIFRWGHAAWDDEFVRPLNHKVWRVNHPKLVRDQHGMLTINATMYSGTVAAAAKTGAHAYGRWEARVRSQQYGHKHTPYQVVMELIPTGSYNCGKSSILVGNYKLGARRAQVAIRNGASEFRYSKARNLANGVFHTYAVEVTKTHISWFVDTHVIMTERRPAARSGETYHVRFRLLAAPGHVKMNAARMQMDWVRYYTLARKNAKSISAPQASLVKDPAHC